MAHAPVLWQQAGNYPAQADRNLLAALWPSGGVFGGVVTAVNNTMTVSVAPGSAAVALQDGSGALCHWDAAEVPPALAAAPGAGTSRIDLVTVQVRDHDFGGGANNDFIMAVVQGTAAASPVAPALPPNALALARVTVPATVANLNTATISGTRPGLARRPALVRTYAPAALSQPTDWHGLGTRVFDVVTDAIPGGYVLTYEFSLAAIIRSGSVGYAEWDATVNEVTDTTAMEMMQANNHNIGTCLLVGARDIPDGSSQHVAGKFGLAGALGGDAQVGYQASGTMNFLRVHQWA